MILLGCDLATSSGLCFGRPQTTPTVRVVRAPSTGSDLGHFGAFWLKTFAGLLDSLQAGAEPDEQIIICYESPIIVEKRWDKQQQKMVGGNRIETARKLYSIGLLLETAAQLHQANTEVFECHLSSMKRELSGSGGADKGQMVLSAQRAGITLPEGAEAFDGADSFAAWLLAVRHKAPEFSPAWDRRVYGQLFRPPGNAR